MRKNSLLKTSIFLLFSPMLWGQISTPCEDGVWYEKDGMAVIEMENQKNLNGWKVESNTTGYTGNGYIIWTGAENFNAANAGQLTYKIKITSPGKYAFDWRVSVNNGTSTTEHNDTWLSITGVDNFWAEKTASPILLKPKPSCNNNTSYKCPEGSTVSNYFKIYGGKVNTFEWKAFTSDNDPHSIFFEKNTEGIININIAARSSFQAIDRLVIYKIPQVLTSTARNLSNSQQDYLCKTVLGTDISEIEDNTFSVYPNPAKKDLTINTESDGKLEIVDTISRVQASFMLTKGINILDISSLNTGTYLVQFSSKQGNKVRKLVVN